MKKRHRSADVIEQKMRERKIKPRALSEKAGLGQTYVRDLLTGRSTSPSTDKLELIAASLGCDLFDLTGDERHKGRLVKNVVQVATEEGNVVYIPEYNVEVSAGDGCAVPDLQDSSRVWRIPKDVLAGISATSIANLVIVTVRGDSMEPDYRPYEKILVDRGDTFIRNDGVYVLSNGIDLMVKMVQVLPPIGRASPSLLIISKNTNYPPYERAFSDVLVNGRVVAKWVIK